LNCEPRIDEEEDLVGNNERPYISEEPGLLKWNCEPGPDKEKVWLDSAKVTAFILTPESHEKLIFNPPPLAEEPSVTSPIDDNPVEIVRIENMIKKPKPKMLTREY